MSVDFDKLRKDDEITVSDGRKMNVKNVYLSPTGLVFVAKGDTSGIADQNIPLVHVTEHKVKKEKGV